VYFRVLAGAGAGESVYDPFVGSGTTIIASNANGLAPSPWLAPSLALFGSNGNQSRQPYISDAGCQFEGVSLAKT